MIPFKNLKYGFSFIEIMIALTLLSIFGSSIFLVQSNIFFKVSKTHQSLFFNQDCMYEFFQLKHKIYQAILEKKPVDGITVHEDKKNPERTINLKLIKISEESELKEFTKNIRIVQSSVTYNNQKTLNRFSFMYIPELIEDQKETEAKQPTTVQS